LFQILKAHLFVLLATFLVAGSFIVSAKLSGVINPISLTLFRFFAATLLFAPIIFLNKKFRNKIVSTMPRAMIMSFFYSLYFIGLFKALETTTALNTGTLFTLVPLITAILCIFFLKEKMSLYQLIVYFIGIIGTSIVVFKGNINLLLNFSLNHGDIIFLFAIVSMALYSIFTKYFHKKDDELVVLVFATLLGGSFWMFFVLEIFDIPLQWEKIQSDLIYHMLYLIIAATFMTVYLYQQASIIIGPKKVMAYVYLNPIAIAVLLFILENQVISQKVVFGIIVSTVVTILLLI